MFYIVYSVKGQKMRPSVYVMMSTYNGEHYVSEQIESILNQSHVDVTIAIRDDGSSDNTRAILNGYAEKHSNISVICGDNLGFAGSFWSLLLSAPLTYDYYAFSDQDDVWEANKLAAAIHVLRQSDNKLKLYASALQVTDEHLNVQYKNEFPKLKIKLGSAITRPRLSGCTMVFGSALLELCQSYDITEISGASISHDVAVYLTALSCGGKVLFSRKSYIKLRRHASTVTGHGKSVFKRIESVLDIFTKRKLEASRQTEFLYNNLKEHMTPDSILMCEDILHYRDSIKNTVAFARDKRNKCNIMSVDMVNLFAILLRCY